MKNRQYTLQDRKPDNRDIRITGGQITEVQLYTQKIWISGCPKSAIGCIKQPDNPLAKDLFMTLVH